jgi:hypothetical protein
MTTWDASRGTDLKWYVTDEVLKQNDLERARPRRQGKDFWANRSVKDAKAPAKVIGKPTRKTVTVIGRKPAAKLPIKMAA